MTKKPRNSDKDMLVAINGQVGDYLSGHVGASVKSELKETEINGAPVTDQAHEYILRKPIDAQN